MDVTSQSWRRRYALLASCGLALTTLAPGAGCTSSDPCDRGALVDALAHARAGDEVLVPACTLTGPFIVPAGVRLRGASAEQTTIVAPEGSTGVMLEPASSRDAPTSLSRLRIESHGCAGVVSRAAAAGNGSVRLEDVEVVATRGVGIGADGLATFVLTHVAITGPVTPEHLTDALPAAPYTCATSTVATHGLVVTGVADASLESVTIRQFAVVGALFVRSQVTWEHGGAESNEGIGLQTWAGHLTLRSARLCGARQGSHPIESYNGLFGGESSVDTTGVTVCDGDAFGLLHDGGSASHVDLTLEGHGFAGLWAQRAAQLHVAGAATRVRDNGFAGIGAIHVRDVSLVDAHVEGTREGVLLFGESARRAADGVHLIDSDASVRDVVLDGNARVGLLADLAGATTSRLGLSGVTVRGPTDALGVVAQNGRVAEGWDMGVTREGALLANDAAHTGLLGVAGIVGPSCIPPPSDLDGLLGN